jgi:hypothetical protein
MLKDYELKYSDVNSLTLKELAAELEEDPDDFISELDDIANSLSEYDAKYADSEFEGDGVDDDYDDDFDKNHEAGENGVNGEDGENGEDGVVLDDEETVKDPIHDGELDDDELDDDEVDDDEVDDDELDDDELDDDEDF